MYRTHRFVSPITLGIRAALIAVDRRKLYGEKSEEAFAAQLAEAKKSAGAPFPAASRFRGVSCKTERAADMEVLLLNDRGDPAQPVVLYLPGGGFLYRPGRLQCRMIGVIARESGAAAVLPLYPLLPDGCAQTALAALETLWRTHPLLGPDRAVTLLGDSAGGGLALSFAMRLRDAGMPLPRQLALYSPWLDLSVSGPETEKRAGRDFVLAPWGLRRLGRLWAGGLPLDDPAVSPLAGDVSGLPSTAIFVGTREILYPESLLLATKLQAAGVPFTVHTYRGQDHVFACYMTPEGAAARARTAALVRRTADVPARIKK